MKTKIITETSKRPRHKCNSDGANGEGWWECPICDGRYHQDGCTSRRNPVVDHCPERHKMLHDAGQVRGLCDSSFLMWTPYFTEGVHESGH